MQPTNAENLKDPNRGSSSTQNMDDLLAKMSALFGMKNDQNQLADTLKKAVKEGIIEAEKEDVRVNDSEEREQERRHRELMQHLNRIAAFGGGNNTPRNNNNNSTDNNDNNDGFGLLDALKWGGLAAGVLGLVSNFESLSKVFGETTDKILGVKNQISEMTSSVTGFTGTIKNLVDNAFSKEGAIGMLLGAFVPGGIIVKTIASFIGGNVSSSLLGNQSGTPNTPNNVSNNGTSGIPVATNTSDVTTYPYVAPGSQTNAGQPTNQSYNQPTSSLANTLGNYNVNNLAGGAAAIATLGRGGSVLGRLARGAITYGLVDYISPERDENGNPRSSLFSSLSSSATSTAQSVTDTVSSLNPYNPDGSLNKEVKQGAAVGGIAALGTAKFLPKNKLGLGLGLAAGAVGFDIGNSNIDGLGAINSKLGLSNISVPKLLGITPPENDYSKRIKEYDDEIARLKKERAEMGIGGSDISKEDYDKLSYSEREKKREELSTKKATLRSKIKELETAKETFNVEVSANNAKVLGEQLKLAPDNPNAGKSEYFDATTGAFALAGAGMGLVGGGLPGAAVGALGAIGTSAAFTNAINTIEQYIEKKFNKKIDILQLAFENPTLAGNLLVEYAKEDPIGSATTFGLLTVGMINPRGAAKSLIGIIKNLPKFGQRVTVSGGTGVIKTTVNYGIGTGAGLLKPAAVAGLGVAASNSIGNQYDILGSSNNIGDVLNTPNSNIQTTLNPSLTKVDGPDGYDRYHSTILGETFRFPATLREKVAMGKYGDPSKETSEFNTPNTQDTPKMFKGEGLNINYSGSETAPYGQSATQNAKQFRGIVMHHAEGSVDNLVKYGKNVDTKRGGSFGYHFYVGENGEIVQGAPMDKRTNHVKPGSAVGLNNSNSIGISMVNAVHGGTPEQVAAATKLARQIQSQYGMDPKMIFGHGEIQGDKMATEGVEVAKALRGFNINSPEMKDIISKTSNKAYDVAGYVGRSLGLTGESGPMDDLVNQILRTESRGGDANSFWGDSSKKYDDLLGGKKLSQLTFGELKEFQKNLEERTKGQVKGRERGTSAAGIGQWLGSTLHGKNYDGNGFLKTYFKGENYDNLVFDEARQKDMFKEFLKSPKHGNLKGFLEGNAGSPEEYAKHLGVQWEGVSLKDEPQKLIATLKKLKDTPNLNMDEALAKVTGELNTIDKVANNLKDTVKDASESVGDAFDNLKNFLVDITKGATALLPKEFTALFDLPGVGEFFSPLFGGESRSSLAHPKRTFDIQEQNELKNMFMGKSGGDINGDKLSVIPSPNISGEQIAQSSKALAVAERAASNQSLGSVINMSGNGAEAIHGQPIAGLTGNIHTHFPGDIDAISARIYQWTDAPMFYASGKLA